MLPIRHIVINVNHMNGITLSLLKIETFIYGGGLAQLFDSVPYGH